MKSYASKAWRLALFFCLILNTNSIIFASTFVDPTLEAWLSISPQGSEFTPAKQEVIVYLKAANYNDRSGLSRPQAIIEEKLFQRSFLREKSKELVTLLPLQAEAIEYLWASNGLIAQVDRVSLQKLRKHPSVDAIIANQIISLDDPKILKSEKSKANAEETQMTYGLKLIHADQAWAQGITGEGVTIGVIDTGADDEHPDLKGKVVLKKDFTDENNNVDGNGHGTHVCGTIVGGNASGAHIGVAPGAKLIVAKTLSSSGSSSLATLLKAMEWMLDPDGDASTNDAPRLVSNSWGASSQFVYGFRNVIRNWRRFGILPNFAAGNSGPKSFSANSPGSYPFSFAIGAVDEDGAITDFSSRGPVVWWKKWHPGFVTKPDISAPGLYVKSSIPGGGWEALSGTSMATPHIAGVAALAWQVNPKLSVEDMMEILETTGLDRGKKGVDNQFGYGIVQVDKVIEKARIWKVDAHSSFQDRDPSLWEWATP